MGIAGASATFAKHQSRRRRPDKPRCSWDGRHARRCRTRGPDETDGYERKALSKLLDGGVKTLRRYRVVLLYAINDVHQVGGYLVRPANGLHGLCGALLAWLEP